MYTDEDLALAVKAGIFNENAVTQFRRLVAKNQGTALIDEEHFRLVSGFNDIFVVIACVLVLISIAWLGSTINTMVSGLALAAASWGLAEFFVRKRKMALPAIVLLCTFIMGTAWFSGELGGLLIGGELGLYTSGGLPNGFVLLFAGVVAALAAWLHWLRFQVPVTVAAGLAALLASCIAAVSLHYPDARGWALALFMASGLLVFVLAMRWDVQDKARLTRKTDVAFWLHLVAAPLIVHPIFTKLGVLSGEGGLLTGFIVIVLYAALATVSIAIDRRALMVSALIYVLYAFTSILNTYGLVSISFAVAGVFIGSMLLMLSAYWHVVRAALMQYIPTIFMQWLPPLKR